MATLTVSMLAKRAGIHPDTVRYYERAGLLRPPARTRAGYRQYDESITERLRFIYQTMVTDMFNTPHFSFPAANWLTSLRAASC